MLVVIKPHFYLIHIGHLLQDTHFSLTPSLNLEQLVDFVGHGEDGVHGGHSWPCGHCGYGVHGATCVKAGHGGHEGHGRCCGQFFQWAIVSLPPFEAWFTTI